MSERSSLEVPKKKKITCQKFYERGRTLVGLKNDSRMTKIQSNYDEGNHAR